MFDQAPVEMMDLDQLSPSTRLRLAGRYGREAPQVVKNDRSGELEQIPGTSSLWAELRWAAKAEAVIHLDDLLLRRVRLGLTIPNGAIPLLSDIQEVVKAELGWSLEKWQSEVESYKNLWRSAYQLPTT